MGIPVNIGVHILGTWVYEVGFIIRDQNSNIVFSWQSKYFSANTLLGTFCPGCVNLDPVQNLPVENGHSEDQTRDGDRQ